MASKTVKKSPAADRGANRAAPVPSVAGWLFPAYVMMIFAGYILLRMPGATIAGQEMGKVRALFSAVNAGTLTGFPQTMAIDKYEALGQATIFGMMICGSVFSLIIGASAVGRILRLKYTDAQIVIAALVAHAAAIGGGAFLLLFDKDRTPWQAVFMAASAFGNCGLLMGPVTPAWQTHLILLPLIVVGGLGLCVLMELVDLVRFKASSFSAHAIATISGTAWVYIVGTVLLVALGLWAGSIGTDDTGGGVAGGSALRGLIASSGVAAIASRTAGIGLVAVEHLSRPAMWVVMLLMAVGGASGSTAGGIKTNTLALVFSGVRRALAGEPVGRAFGIAASWLGGYLLLVTVALLCMLHLMPQMATERVIFTAISAASNVGLTHEPLSPDPGAAYALCATMLIGRLAPMMILWWMADSTHDAELAAG